MTTLLGQKSHHLGQSRLLAHERAAGALRKYESVERLMVVDALYYDLIIQSADGSELALGPWHLTAVGDCVASARVLMAADADWRVDPIDDGPLEAQFRRDAEVEVGQPFRIVLTFPSQQRRIQIAFSSVAAIGVRRT